MKREKQIREAAKKTTGLFSYRNGYSTAEDAFVEGARWADRTILKEVLIWLDDHTYDEQYLLDDTPDAVGIAPYHTKEAMLRSFKERFNIE